MPTANTASAYGTVTKTFHWLTALLIIAVAPLGAIANQLPYETNEQLAAKANLFSIHKTLGVVIFAVALARILWAVGQPKPGGLHPNRRAENMLAEVVHWLLYISLVAVPLTGWIDHAATTGFAPILLPIGQSLPLVPKSEAVAELFGSLHWIWTKVMIAAILLHIAGALKHHVIDKDATLRRMWFGKATGPQTDAHKGTFIAPLAALGIFAIASGAGAAAGMFTAQERQEVAELATVTSDWVVKDGTIAITVMQLGSPVTGKFGEWTSDITFDPVLTGTMGAVTTTVAIGSLTLGSVTGQAMGADFFDAASFPTATFAADIREDGTRFIADGTLGIKGATVPVALPFDLTITENVATMNGQITLDRRDFMIGTTMNDETNLGFSVVVDVSLTATKAVP